MGEKSEESLVDVLKQNNDFQLSLLHVILKQPLFDKLSENEIIQHHGYDKKLQTNSSRHSPSKLVSHKMFPVLQNQNDTALLNNKRVQEKIKSGINSIQSKHRPKKITKNRDIDISIYKKCNSSLSIKQQTYLKQKNFKKSDHTYYVFDQYHSFYPAHVPIKYGFQMRSLIENNHLPMWRFSNQDKNQIIYNPFINQNSSNKINRPSTLPSSSKQLKFSSSTAIIQKSSSAIDTHIQRRWINLLLKSGQSKGDPRQLSPTVDQSSQLSSISITHISRQLSSDKIVSPKNCSNKRQNQQQCKIKRRARCTTFEEHLQRYYLPKWCLIYTKDFKQQKIKKNFQSLS